MSPLRRQHAAPPAPFIVGVGRSGTTLLRLMLDAHPELAIPPETHFVPELIALGHATREELVATLVEARHWSDFGLDRDELRSRIAALEDPEGASAARAFYSLYAERQRKPRWGDKTPIYVRHMRAIAKSLPEARFVHLIRDGRDVALSRRRRGMGAGKPMADTAQLWRRRIEAARQDAGRLGDRYLELRYEDLVAEPEAWLRRICGFIELEFDPAMLAHQRRAADRLQELAGGLPEAGRRQARSGEERLRAHALAVRPPTPDRTARWREEMGAADVREFEAVAGELLAELGYDLSS